MVGYSEPRIFPALKRRGVEKLGFFVAREGVQQQGEAFQDFVGHIRVISRPDDPFVEPHPRAGRAESLRQLAHHRLVGAAVAEEDVLAVAGGPGHGGRVGNQAPAVLYLNGECRAVSLRLGLAYDHEREHFRAAAPPGARAADQLCPAGQRRFELETRA